MVNTHHTRPWGVTRRGAAAIPPAWVRVHPPRSQASRLIASCPSEWMRAACQVIYSRSSCAYLPPARVRKGTAADDSLQCTENGAGGGRSCSLWPGRRNSLHSKVATSSGKIKVAPQPWGAWKEFAMADIFLITSGGRSSYSSACQPIWKINV